MKKKRRILSTFLAACMVTTCMVGMSVTASAATGITINITQHGTVTASSTSAEQGATVTLTANPDNGYGLKSISGTYKGYPTETKSLGSGKTINGTYFNYSATDAAGAGWKLANNSSIKISSTSKTITKVEFNIYQRGNSFNVNNVSCTVGTKSLNGNTLVVSSVNTQSITLSSSVSNAGYVRFNSVKVYYNGDAVDEMLSISGTGNVRTFTMPTVASGNVSITAEFEEIPKYSVTLTGGANATPAGGSTTQPDLTGAMTTVTYTANTGYYFEEFTDITDNGITATRTNETTVTVSGTPTANASITIPNAVLAHTHSWNYTAEGATITASCTEGCDITTGLTLTISAPTSLTYDGTAKTATLSTGYDTTNAFPYVSAISYKKGSDTLTGAPTDVGTYTASVSAGASAENCVPASVTYSITKGTPTITAAPTPSAITYGQTLEDSTLSGGAASVGGTFAWKTPTTAPTVADSNSTEYTVVFTPTDSTSYSAVETTVKVTVNKADPETPTGLTAKTGQTLANVSLPDGWSWVDAGTTSVGEVGDNTFKANYTPTGTDATNYNSKTNVELTVTVSSSVTYTLVPAKAATCTATGNKEYYKGSDGKYYTKNGDTYTETTLAAVTIAKTAHTLTAVAAVDAKCTTDGTKAHYKCSVCEKLFEDADGKTETTADALKVTKLGHNYVNGKCTRCGATDPNYGGNSGGYTPVIPSGGTTTTTTTTNTGSFADETKENTNYSGAEINMKSDELEKAVLTDEDKKVIDAGGTVTVKLEVEEMTPTAEEKNEVEAAVEAAKEASGEDYTVAMYFDANLFKTSNGTKTQLHETNGKIAVSFKLPAQFKNTDSSVTRTYAVARIHDGKTEILVCEYDPETDLLTFYTDKFSTYALMYEDAAVEAADVSAADDKTLTATVSRTGNVKLSWSVQTGAQSYSVYQAKDGKWVKLGTTSKTTYTVKNLTNNKTYKFMLRANVNGKLVAKADAMTLKVKVYFKPAVKLTANKGSITIKWNKVPEAEKYRVYKLVNGKLRLVTETEKHNIRITGTKAGKEYSYAVKAYVDGKWTKVYTSDVVSVTAK